MNATSTLLIIVAILVAMVLGVLLAVTISLYYASRQIKLRIDKLDEHLVILVETIENLDQSSTIELKALHDSLAEQQIVHKSIAKSSKIFNLVFKKPAVIVGASKKTIDNSKKRKKRNAKV
ncbi:MAG: hypothetical protein KBF89_02200 [Acidimicrobiia bacterium]|nr:hypothetical protein [Acidimicrobiia bacterium]